jgi:hypothetical protein
MCLCFSVCKLLFWGKKKRNPLPPRLPVWKINFSPERCKISFFEDSYFLKNKYCSDNFSTTGKIIRGAGGIIRGNVFELLYPIWSLMLMTAHWEGKFYENGARGFPLYHRPHVCSTALPYIIHFTSVREQIVHKVNGEIRLVESKVSSVMSYGQLYLFFFSTCIRYLQTYMDKIME